MYIQSGIALSSGIGIGICVLVFALWGRRIVHYFEKNNLGQLNNVISIFVLGIILVIFCLDISFSNLFILKSLINVCVVIISVTFSMIISSIYNWSDNFFIRTVQKSIFYIILFIIGYLLLIYRLWRLV